MGISKHVYVGPYVEVQLPKPKPVRTDRCKAPAQCSDPQEAFCPKCGLETANRFAISKMQNVDLWELLEDAMTEPLREDEAGSTLKTLIPNRRSDFCWHDPEGAVEIPLAAMVDGIENLCRDYKDCLDKLANASLAFTVKWGIITSYS